MYNLDIYNKKIELNNIFYSVDMIRLKTYISYQQFKELEFMVNALEKSKIKKMWVSDRPMCFKYNYVIEIDEQKIFYFAFLHNNEKIKFNDINTLYNFTIEFNPNKLKDNSLLIYILNLYNNWLIKSIDFAIDIPINILDLLIDINKKRKVQSISYGGDNITYYLGKGDGRVKVYNKKIESDLKIVGNLTRIEISREYEDFPVSNIKNFKFDIDFLPLIFLNQYLVSFTDGALKDKTLNAILFAVQNGFPIKDLSRVYKEKLKTLLDGSSKLKFDKKSIEQSLQQMIYFYFIRKESKQIFI